MLVLAAITDKLVDFATNVVGDLGLFGVFALMVPESACIPIPSEATMLFSGLNLSPEATHPASYTLFTLTLVGVVANVVGSWIAYAIGYYGRIELLEKHGRKLHVKKSDIERADRWFARHGEATVFFARMLPIVRTFISLPAGVARMPFWRFTLFTFVGCVPWVFALAFVGKQAGDHWTDWKDSLHYVDYVVLALVVVGIAYWFVRRRRRGAEAPAEARALVGPGRRPRPAAGTRGAPADLEQRPPRARARAPRLVVRRARRRAAQVVRGGAPRGHRARAPDRAARRGGRGGALARRAAARPARARVRPARRGGAAVRAADRTATGVRARRSLGADRRRPRARRGRSTPGVARAFRGRGGRRPRDRSCAGLRARPG